MIFLLVLSSRMVLRRARAIVEQRDNFLHRQRMSFSLGANALSYDAGKLPLVFTSFANLTTDESFEAVPIATDYEKLIPIHYFYFPVSLTSGVRIRTVIKSGYVCAHASAFCLLPKNRSMTMALRSAAFRPHERPALRLTTSGPLSTATHSASGKTTLLRREFSLDQRRNVLLAVVYRSKLRARLNLPDASKP